MRSLLPGLAVTVPFAALALSSALAMLAPSVALADVKLQVRVDRKSLTLDDTLTLQVSVESRGAKAPDVEMPDLDGFDVVSQQVQRPMQFSFNFGSGAVVQSQMVYTYGLRPTRVGTITIKPIVAEMDGERKASAPIAITVSEGSGGKVPAAPAPDQAPDQDEPQREVVNASRAGGLDLAEVDGSAFIRAVADKATPYVGEQVTVTLYLYTREQLRGPPATEMEPTTDGFWVHDLLGNQQSREQRQVVQGAVYAVYPLRRFAAFPLRSGELTIGPMALRMDTSSVFDIFGGRRRGDPVITRKGQPLVFQVKPLPERATQDPRAGEPLVGRFSVESKLDRASTATGDAVTLTVVVRGQGNVRDVKFPTPVIDGLDVLEPEVKDFIEAPDDRVGGTRELRYLLVPRAPGTYKLPEFALTEFDPATERYRRVASTPMTLEVVGNALPAAAAAQPGASEPSEPADDDGAKPAVSKREWAPIRTESALAREHELIAEQPWFWPSLALPAVLYAAWMTVRARKRRLAARGDTAASRAEREAENKLQAATAAARQGDGKAFFAAAAGVVLATLEARLGEPATGFTHGELRRHLIERGMSEPLAREVVGLLERADHHRFGGASTAAALDAELHALTNARARLADFSPTATEAA